MHKVFRIAGSFALTACGGEGGGGITNPDLTPVPPPISAFVREAIPYDSLGGTTIYFKRSQEGHSGYVQLNAPTRSASMVHVSAIEFSPAASAAANLLAYWEFDWASNTDGIFVRPLGSLKSAAVRVSAGERRLRGGPAWSPDGRFLYYLEESGTQGVSRIIRQSPVRDASDRSAIITLPRSCGLQRAHERLLSIASTGDVAVSQTTVNTANQCIQQILRWRAADQSLTVVSDLPGGSPLPAWSPDGSRLAVMTRSLGRTQIRIMDADGSNAAVIHDIPLGGGTVLGIDPSICWSADGSRIIFSAYAADYVARIWAIRPSGAGLTPITSPTVSPSSSGAPAVGADGGLSCTT